jgi:hypothetical protein
MKLATAVTLGRRCGGASLRRPPAAALSVLLFLLVLAPVPGGAEPLPGDRAQVRAA